MSTVTLRYHKPIMALSAIQYLKINILSYLMLPSTSLN